MEEKNVYRCESCGGIMEFDAASQTLKCPNCDSTIEIINDKSSIEEHKLTIDDKRVIKVSEKQSTTMSCTGCGAQIEVNSNETAAMCPYCGSKYVLAKNQADTLIPDGVVPFKIDKNQVADNFRKWMKKRYLAPSDLKNLYQHGGLQGIYIPYWTFDADAKCWYNAEGGRYRNENYRDKDGNMKSRRVTDWYYTRGSFTNFFDDVPVPASTRFKNGMFKGIEPYDLKQLASYTPQYISGNLSENYSIGLEDGHRDAIIQIDNRLRNMAQDDVRKRYDTVRNVRIKKELSRETYKYILIPLYSTAFSYKNKNYNVLINGQTGKVNGEYPKSPVKIAIIVIVIIIIILLGFIFKHKQEYDDLSYNTNDAYEYVDNDFESEYDAYKVKSSNLNEYSGLFDNYDIYFDM